jgi:3-hydroxyisobutyrate dehydrogenase-like beta-hydroxyacid dehydrogenase
MASTQPATTKLTSTESRAPLPTAAIGFVGLGAISSRMAGRLLGAGGVVHGTGATGRGLGPLLERGLIWHGSPREVAQQAEVVFGISSDTAALEQIAAGADGLLAGLRPGSLYVEMGTVDPARSREVAELVRARDAEMLEAPFCGGLRAAERGSLAIMVGGERSAFARVEPFLRELAGAVTFVGANGTALMLKLAVDISLAAHAIAVSEGVLLAERGGVAPELAAEVLSSSTAGTSILGSRGQLLLERSDDAGLDIEQMQREIAIALEQGKLLAVPLPAAALANELLTVVGARQWEDGGPRAGASMDDREAA